MANVILNHTDAIRIHARTHQPFDRVQTGLLLHEIGALWTICCDLALVQDTVDSSKTEDRDTAVKQYEGFSTAVFDHGLEGVWNLKPLLNVSARLQLELTCTHEIHFNLMQGTDVGNELKIKPGPSIKEMLDQVLRWQLKYPKGTREECLVHIRRGLKS